ncbi:MAG: methyl-accepting chemotaxis protein [Gammaproteobacteria bacterium]|nr:methyl-accepting chemotaxis protein [Gammaproteobacteria bacterium]
MTLKTKLLSTGIPFVIVIIIAIMAVETYGKNVVIEQAEQADLTAKKNLWNKIVSSRIEAMSGGLFAVTRNSASLEAIMGDDREGLAQALLPTYNRLSAGRIIDKLVITDSQSRVLYSSASEISGKTDMPLVSEAISQGRIKQGLQRDDAGMLSIVYVFPMYKKPGQPLGAGVFLSSLQRAIAEFKESEGSDAFILDQSGRLEYATSEELWSSIGAESGSVDTGSFEYVTVDGMAYHVGKSRLSLDSTDQSVYLVTAKDETELYNANRFNNFMAIGISIVLMVIMALGIYALLHRALKPISNIVSVLNNVAQGDFSNDIEIKGSGKDEIGQILTAVRDMQETLSQGMKQTSETAKDLATSSQTMSQLAAKTTMAVTQQQSESDQVVAAMNQMTSTVTEVARNANSAAASARDADTEASKGREVVNQSISAIQSLAQEVERGAGAIKELENESTNIGSVLDVIRDIADQTNLLALNAAIEAARAGEQGRGFAVVADEVRTLASRTAESTAEIQQMIERLQAGAHNAVEVMESSRNQAGSSVERAAEAGQALETIAGMIASITDMNAQIASAAEEQTAVADEINRNVVNINDATISIAESANEVEEAGEHLVSLSNGLNNIVSQFKLK